MAIDAVIFDWGGTLTRWHEIDFVAEAAALASAVVDPGDPADHAQALARAGDELWGRSRDHQQSARIDDIFAGAGLAFDPERLAAYKEFWEPHTGTDPGVRPLWEALRNWGIRIGVLSNTIWPGSWHREFFARDGVLDLIDGDVYSSEIAWTKPSPEAFMAAVRAVGLERPDSCVYVGDRLFDDIWGASNAGLRTIHIPHSNIPIRQVGHTEGTPDAVAHELADVVGIVDSWR